MTVLPDTELAGYVAALARRLAGFPQQALTVLKQQLARDRLWHAMQLAHALTPLDNEAPGAVGTLPAPPSVSHRTTTDNLLTQTPQRLRLQ